MSHERELLLYARAIEKRWSGMLDRPTVLSPREWSRVRDWFERGIPLDIVEDAIEEARQKARRGRGRPPRSLGYLATAIEEAWAVVQQGRVPEPVAVDGPVPDEVPAAWQQVHDALPADSPLRRLLAELIEHLGQGADRLELDSRLDGELPDAVPRATRDEVERDVRQELAPFRGRMEPTVFDRTVAHALIDRLRRRFGLARLAARSGAS